MEKKFKVTKKTVLKNQVPESFETTEQWVKDNKRFARHFIIEEIKPEVIQEIEKPEIVEKTKKAKKEIVIEPEKQIENNEEIS